MGSERAIRAPRRGIQVRSSLTQEQRSRIKRHRSLKRLPPPFSSLSPQSPHSVSSPWCVPTLHQRCHAVFACFDAFQIQNLRQWKDRTEICWQSRLLSWVCLSTAARWCPLPACPSDRSCRCTLVVSQALSAGSASLASTRPGTEPLSAADQAFLLSHGVHRSDL